jgi:hypothetical protein
MTTLFILNVPENENVPVVAASDPAVTISKVGPYFKIDSASTIVIDRRATGCRHAVWYSCVGGLADARISQYDKDALRVEPR